MLAECLGLAAFETRAGAMGGAKVWPLEALASADFSWSALVLSKFPAAAPARPFVDWAEKMAAREGIEPPTPAFSDLVQPEPITTYRFAGDC